MATPTYHLEKIIKTKEDYEDFTGPLDLILHLLSKNKIEIKDIQVSQILEQYLAYLDEMKQMDLEVASEFVAMASHLVYIKTRMLLSIDEREAREEMELLIKSLEERRRVEEYKKMRFATEYLDKRAEIGRSVIIKKPQMFEVDRNYEHVHEAGALPDAISAIRLRTRRRLPPPASAFRGIVGREAYPVARKVSELLQKLLFTPVARFRELLRGSASRSEIVATFLAVLELVKGRQVEAGDETENDFSLRRTDGGPNGH